ncbi:putative Ig domain-containing protein [Herbiconiux sp. P17]|uniref:virginiamycin B lyase family protein n=1 Tax=Herbiconiux wuyangfengii TaxID=3342794 RepID=UPI0035B8C2D7
MRFSRLAILPLAAGLAFGGVAAAAAGAPVVTDVLATLPTGSLPSALVVDGAANVYTLNANDTISKVAFDGTLSPAWASLAGVAPRDIVTKNDGTLYTANLTGTISQVTPNGTVTASFATLAPLAQPLALALASDGSLFTANSGTNSIAKVSPTGVVTPAFASLVAGSKPFDIVVSAAGDLYTLNQNTTISKATATGMVTPAFATLSSFNPVNLAVSSSGHVFVLEAMPNQIEEFDASGVRVRTIALPTQAGQIAIDSHDNILVTLRATKSIGLIPTGGALVPSIATLTPGADYGPLAVTSTNTVYAAGLTMPIITRISLGAKITSAAVNASVVVGAPFRSTVTASGYEPLTYSLTGSVPPGVSINKSTGVISGPPTTAGTYRFNVVASNLFGSSSTQEATLAVTAAPMPTPTPAPTPSGTATPVPGTGSGGGTGVGASGSLANTGSTVWLPGTLALLLAAAGVAGLVAERRRRRA